MLHVNLRDGTTVVIDIDDDREEWQALRNRDITGLAFVFDGHHYSLPIPIGFQSVRFDARTVQHRNGSGDTVGRELAVFVGGIKATVLVYTGNRPKMVRFRIEVDR